VGADPHGAARDTPTEHPVHRALRDPASLGPEEVAALSEHVRSLSKEQARQLALAFRQKIGGTKAQIADRLLEAVRNAKKPDPEPEKPKVAIDYRQKDPDDPIAKAILADTKARKVLERVRAKAQEIEPARNARFEAELDLARKRDAYHGAADPGPYKKSKAWQAKFDARRKAFEEYNDADSAYQKAAEAEQKARDGVRKEVVEALAHDTHSELRETWATPDDLPSGVNELPKTRESEAVVQGAREFVTSVCANLGDVKVAYGLAASERAFAQQDAHHGAHVVTMSRVPVAGSDASVLYATQTQVHELGHVVEFSKPDVKRLANEFIEYRCKGESLTKLATVFGGYREDEEGRKDEFDRAFGSGSGAYYIGKPYTDGSTEVVSMGLQKLYEDPDGFVTKDPEYAQFLFKILSM
jgi:hypothetical protein